MPVPGVPAGPGDAGLLCQRLYNLEPDADLNPVGIGRQQRRGKIGIDQRVVLQQKGPLQPVLLHQRQLPTHRLGQIVRGAGIIAADKVDDIDNLSFLQSIPSVFLKWPPNAGK